MCTKLDLELGNLVVFFTEVRGAASNSAYYGCGFKGILLKDTTPCLRRDSTHDPLVESPTS
jgi:hypothetical protein